VEATLHTTVTLKGTVNDKGNCCSEPEPFSKLPLPQDFKLRLNSSSSSSTHPSPFKLNFKALKTSAEEFQLKFINKRVFK
jgi:hypothetical protein